MPPKFLQQRGTSSRNSALTVTTAAADFDLANLSRELDDAVTLCHWIQVIGRDAEDSMLPETEPIDLLRNELVHGLQQRLVEIDRAVDKGHNLPSSNLFVSLLQAQSHELERFGFSNGTLDL